MKSIILIRKFTTLLLFFKIFLILHLKYPSFDLKIFVGGANLGVLHFPYKPTKNEKKTGFPR